MDYTLNISVICINIVILIVFLYNGMFFALKRASIAGRAVEPSGSLLPSPHKEAAHVVAVF